MQKSSHLIQLGIAPINSRKNKALASQPDVLSGTMSDISKAQFHGVELSQDFPQDPMLLHPSLRSAGIRVSGAQFRAHFTDDAEFTHSIHRFIDHMHFLNAINTKVVMVCEMGKSHIETEKPMLSDGPNWSTTEWKRLIAGLKRISALAAQNNMTIVYQPHIGTGIHSEQSIHQLMEATDNDAISLLIDTGQLAALGIKAEKIIKAYPERIKYVYVSDMKQRVLTKVKRDQLSYKQAKEAGLFTFPGQGSIKFDPVFSALKKANFNGWVVLHGEQDDKNPSFAVQAKAFRKYLKSILGV